MIQHRVKARGFTLIELAVVVLILSILLLISSRALGYFREQNTLSSGSLKIYSDLSAAHTKAIELEEAVYFEVRSATNYRVYESSTLYSTYQTYATLPGKVDGVNDVELDNEYKNVVFADYGASNPLLTYAHAGDLSTLAGDHNGFSLETDTNGYQYYRIRLQYGTASSPKFSRVVRVYLNGRLELR